MGAVYCHKLATSTRRQPAAAPLLRHSFFQLLERRPHMPRNRAPAYLDRQDRRQSFDKRHHANAQHVVIGVLVVGGFRHVRGDRPQQAVAHQNAEKRAHQRCRHVVADLLRRAAQRAHGDDHAQHRGHNSQARQGIRHRAQGGHRLAGRRDGARPCPAPSSGRYRTVPPCPPTRSASVSQMKLLTWWSLMIGG